MENWETFRDCTGRVFTVKPLSDEYFSFNNDFVVIDNIKSFEEKLNTWKKLIYKDESYFTGYKIFIDTMQKDFNRTKYKFDDFYKNSDLDDEDFFFIANFYNNLDYLPNCLKEDFLEIYGGN
jgi:hypothetical protein